MMWRLIAFVASLSFSHAVTVHMRSALRAGMYAHTSGSLSMQAASGDDPKPAEGIVKDTAALLDSLVGKSVKDAATATREDVQKQREEVASTMKTLRESTAKAEPPRQHSHGLANICI